jgi:hypothetical protein
VPALPVVPNVIRVDIEWTVGTDAAAMDRIFIAYSGGPPTSANCVTLAGLLYIIFAAELAIYTNANNALTGVRVTDLASSTGGQGEHLQTTVGSIGPDDLGANSTALASMRIGRRYRGGKPRSYFPLGGASVMQTPQTWTSAFQVNVQAALNAIIADIAVTTAGTTVLTHLVNVSYYHGFTVVTNPITGRARNVPTLRPAPIVDPVLSWVMELKLASQRRRLLRQP